MLLVRKNMAVITICAPNIWGGNGGKEQINFHCFSFFFFYSQLVKLCFIFIFPQHRYIRISAETTNKSRSDIFPLKKRKKKKKHACESVRKFCHFCHGMQLSAVRMRGEYAIMNPLNKSGVNVKKMASICIQRATKIGQEFGKRTLINLYKYRRKH